MTNDTARLLQKALRLQPELRAALAGLLLESLEETVDSDAETAWKTEIESRIDQLEAGRVHPVAWPDARRIIARQ